MHICCISAKALENLQRLGRQIFLYNTVGLFIAFEKLGQLQFQVSRLDGGRQGTWGHDPSAMKAVHRLHCLPLSELVFLGRH